MKRAQMKRREDAFAVVAVAIFLLLTAWGNATAMMVVGVIGCIVGLAVFGRRTFCYGVLAATISFAVATAIAIVMTLSRGH